MSDTQIRIVAKDDSAAAFKTAINNINNLKAGMSGLTTGLASGIIGGLSVAGLVNFARSAIDSMDALNDLKDATGASIENISALEDVAARTGTKFDTVGAALVKFNGILNSADPDSGAAAALKAIGLEADRLKGIDPAEALRQTAVALAQFADDGNKARIVQDLFGKSVKDAAPFLKDLAEQGALVGSVTTKQAEEAEKFNKSLLVMGKNITDLNRVAFSALLTRLNEVADKFREGRTAMEGFNIGSRAFFRMEPATVNTGGASGDFGLGAGGGRGSVNPAFVKPSIGTLPNKPTKPAGGSGGAKTDPEAQAKRYLESLQLQLEKTQELTAVESAMAAIQSGRIGKASTTVRSQILALAEQLDGVKAQTEAEKRLAEAIKETSAAQEAFFASVMRSDDAKQAQIGSLLDATPSANLERQRGDMQLLTAEFEAGRISESLYLEAVTTRLDLAAEKMATTRSLADDLNLSFTSAFEDAMVGGKGLSEVLAGLEQDIMRIITRKLVTEPLGNAISGAISGSGFNPGNFISGLFSADGGGYTGGGPRTGGVDGKGGFMAVLHPQETVVDHTKGQGMGKTNNVTVNVSQSFAPNTSRATTMQAAADARRQLEHASRNL